MEKLKFNDLSDQARKIVEPYVNKLISIHKENILSINLYGSATGQDYSVKTSDVNLLIILKELNFQDLKKSLGLVAKGIKKKIAAPLFLSLEHIKTSQDVFPIEFLEMKENHQCLYGEDILEQLEIKRDHLRFVCEQQIKGKLIRLRQAYLEIGLKKKGIEALMKESLNSLVPVFRNLLRLKNITPGTGKEQILTAVSQEFGLEKDVFLAIFRDKQNDEKIAGQDIEVYFEKYLEQIKKLALAVDKI